MFFKNLLTKWKESLEIFKWQNLKLFLLASLNNFKKSLIIFIKNFPIMIFCMLGTILFLYCVLYFFDIINKHEPIASSCGNLFLGQLHVTSENTISIWKTLIVYASIGSVFVFHLTIQLYLYLIIRPSIENKNLTYFLKYANKIIGVVLISMILSIFDFLFLPIIPFCIIFFLDSKNSIKSFFFSLLNGFQILIYNIIPILTFGLLMQGIIYFFDNTLFTTIPNPNPIISIYKILTSTLLRFFYLCAISIYYTKIKHKDFNLFLFE